MEWESGMIEWGGRVGWDEWGGRGVGEWSGRVGWDEWGGRVGWESGAGVWGGRVGQECGVGEWGGSVGWESGVGVWGGSVGWRTLMHEGESVNKRERKWKPLRLWRVLNSEVGPGLCAGMHFSHAHLDVYVQRGTGLHVLCCCHRGYYTGRLLVRSKEHSRC